MTIIKTKNGTSLSNKLLINKFNSNCKKDADKTSLLNILSFIHVRKSKFSQIMRLIMKFLDIGQMLQSEQSYKP